MQSQAIFFSILKPQRELCDNCESVVNKKEQEPFISVQWPVVTFLKGRHNVYSLVSEKQLANKAN